MAEVLSQQEIDQLLNNVKSGSENEPAPTSSDKEIMTFDFRLPNRISKNQLRSLRTIHENFAESFSAFLVNKLQTIVNINVSTVDQIYYSEYILSVSNPACLYTFNINNTDIRGILEVSPDLALALVDRLLGGSGTGSKQAKVITPIEQKVIKSIVEKVMLDLKKAWMVIDNFDFQIERFESDIDFAQITSQSESVLLISFEVVIGEQTYLMNICFAIFSFDSILSKLSSQKMSAIRPVKYQGTTAQEIISNHLYKTYLPVTVEFGTANITIKDLYSLEKGDIIKLNTKVSDEHIVKIDNREFFYGRVGVVNKHMAIKITRSIDHNEKL